MQKVDGKEISITFDGKKCIHSRNCVLAQPAVFRAGVEGDWIFPDSADVEDIVMLARNCPSGAIQYERLDGGTPEPVPAVNTVRVMENGPLFLNADIRTSDGSRQLRATLCRCGQSALKPYCDGSHLTSEFVATGEIEIGNDETLERRDGPVQFTPLPNGPLMLHGNVEILRGSGKKASVKTQIALCRCGASKRKPYCDGSHTSIGFKAS